MKKCPMCDKIMSDEKDFCSTVCKLENDEFEAAQQESFQKFKKRKQVEK